MRKLVVAAAIVFGMSCAGLPAHAQAGQTFGQGVGTAVDAVNPIQSAGCYRWGESGYHWYRSCFGPRWIYPHRRYCRNGQCSYR
jgi:hypothetical protein